MKKKIAIILFNLGGPDKLSSVKPFLFNLFNDPAIIQAPFYIRYFIAKLISIKREKTAKEIYSHIGGKSPIYEETLLQAKKLTKILKSEETNFKVFIAMRYWKPFVSTTIQKVKKWGPKEIILLPLYPQYSTTTTESSINSWKKEVKKASYFVPTKIICCYPKHAKFISAHVTNIKKIFLKINNLRNTIVLFSAHGLPEKIIKQGDPYQFQIELTANKIIDKLNNNNCEYKISYQSKVGPLKWIGPSTEEEIVKASKMYTNIIVVPVAFVSEHSETLVELDIEYKNLAKNHGCENYYRVPALGIDKEFMESLKDLILIKSKGPILNENICSNSRKKCFYNNRNL